ncbi:MAG: SCO family protein [Planctomycetota bacterium]
MIKPKAVLIIIGIAGLAFSGILLAALYPEKTTGQKLPVIERAPDFELINQDEQPINLSQFRGKVVVLSFIYVSCHMPKQCPMTTKNFKKLQELLGPGYADKTALLLISFDPERDQPGALKKYGELYGVDFRNWSFLTGSQETIDKVSADYQFIKEKETSPISQPGDVQSYRHSLITFLIDQNTNIRKMYFGNTWVADDIKKDIISLNNNEK